MNAEKRINYNFGEMKGIFERPETLNNFAREKLERVKRLLEGKEKYGCPSSCKRCCYGTILMSYTEFTYIMLYLQEEWKEENLHNFFKQKVGLLQEDRRALLCPFLEENAFEKHCLIYPARPLICRVFGTTAAECGEPIVPSFLDEKLFYFAYNLLYYSGEQFIALNLDEKIALYEAPFALWCLADDSSEGREFLIRLIEKEGDSFQGVLYERPHNRFFVLENGVKKGFSDHFIE